MKILFLLILINYNFFKNSVKFFKKLFFALISILYILEYFLIFIFNSYYFYLFFLYKYLKKEYFLQLKQKKNNTYNYIYEKKKINKNNYYTNQFLKFYYKRKMYVG